jgi:CheY-like chemotaxis protein
MLLQNVGIFVVEDNLENRIITRLLLLEHGARIAFDIWGRDTISRLRVFAPVDLILMDLMLPRGVSGFSVFDTLRSTSDLAHIPIVGVSAADPAQAMPLCRDKGFAGFIAKPIDDELFPRQLVKILNHENVWYAG